MIFLYYNIGAVQRQTWPLMGYYSTGYISTKAEGCGFHGCALDQLWSERLTYYIAYLWLFCQCARQMVKNRTKNRTGTENVKLQKKGNCVA